MDRTLHVDGGSATDEGPHAAELLELGDAFFEMDREWRIVRVNSRQEQLSGKPRETTVGRTFAEVWPDLATPDSRYWREYRRCMEERVPVAFEEYYAPIDMWTGVTAYPVSGGGVAVFFRDITRLKRAEADARAREVEAGERAAEVEAVLGSVADGVVVYDADGRILRANDAATAILGYDARERSLPAAERIAGRGETWATESGERVTPDQLPPLRAARLGETLRGVVLRRRSGGREQWLRISAAPLVFDGRRVGAVASMSDLTGHKRAEQALRESERRLRAMFEDAAVGIVEVDEDDRFVAVNARFCAMLGYRREELLGRTLHEITAPEDAERTRDLNARGHSGALRVFDYEKRYLRRDGTPLWVHVNVSVIRDDAGRFVRAIGTVEDITERKRAEQALHEANERLREADRRKDEFLGMLSHELRNPLAPVRNSLYILDRAAPDSAQARRARGVASRQITHMTRLVDDLLDVTRIARGKIELRRADVDLAALTRRTAGDQRGLMTARGLELIVEVPRDPVTVHGDETRLAQVLGNLLHNASKFTPSGGRVSVSLQVEDGTAVVHVRDTGAGMTVETMRTIFEPFTQGEQTLARSEGGLGLGLALVKGLVELHGGSVAATSAGPGQGTDFAVRLPLSARHVARPSPAPARASVRDRSRRVLVIDDNRDAADSLAELVSMLGHRVEVAYDAYDGLARTAEELPDVVLCDIGLPGMDGYEFARQLRARSGDGEGVRLVAVSGYAQPEDVARAVEAGFDAHIAKPPDPERLAALCG